MERGAADNFKFNTETEFTPILGQLGSDLNAPKDEVQSSDNHHQTASSIQNNHHSVFLSLLAEELNVKPDEIHDFEL